MKLIKKGKKISQTFKGSCSSCGAVFEAIRSELQVKRGDQREPGEFAHKNCTECGAKAGMGGIIFYPKES